MLRRFAPIPLIPLLVAPLAGQGTPHTLGDLQVTATRVPAAIGRTPAAITILAGDDLRAQGIASLLDALRLVPGAATVQAGSYGAVASLFLRGGENDFTKLLVDGIPVNLPGGQLNLASIPLDDVERIEVVRGPVSVQHGADAMSGVIQVFTRRGAGPLRGQLEWTGGTWGVRSLRGGARGSHGRWHAALSGARLGAEGTYAFNNDYLNATGSAVLGWEAPGQGGITLTAHLGDALARFPTDGGGIPSDINQRVLDTDVAVGVTSHRTIGADATMHADAWWHHLDSRLRDPRDAPGDTTGFGFAASREAEVGRRGGLAWVEWRVREGIQLTAGLGAEQEVESQRSETHSDFGFGRDVSRGSFREERATVHGNLQLLLAAHPDVDLQLGLRHDNNTAFGGFTTWRSGIVWRMDEAWRAWVAGGNGFKAPTFSELFAQSAFEVGNPDLRPERSHAVEAGLAWQGRRTSVGLTVFHQRYRDLIQYIGAAPGDPTYANLGAARSRGVELATTVALSRTATLRGHWSWLGTVVTDSGAASSVTFAQGQRLLRRPEHSAALTGIFRHRSATLALEGHWTGARDDVDFRDFPASRTTLPSYVVVHAALGVPVPVPAHGWPTLELVVRGENLLDAAWEQAVGFPGRGRTVLVGGRLSW